MVRRDGTYESEVRENMRGGNGAVKIEHLWKKDELGSKTRLCARLTLAPGSGIGYHEHNEEEEIFIVNSGRGVVHDGEERTHVEPGDTILTGNGSAHAVECEGSEPLVLTALIVQY